MKSINRKFHFRVYLFFTGLFICSLVVSNIIIQKFFYWYPFPFEIHIAGVRLFELSVGILPYPITFLITDVVSEIYGKKKASEMILAGIFASIFSLVIIYVSLGLPIMADSPIDNETFSKVFAATPLAIIGSMTAYFLAQTLDINLYHFLKKVTKGRFLWLRNNFSTVTSQFVDTTVVISLFAVFGILPWSLAWGLILSGFIFKVLIAMIDTPIIYIIVIWYRKRFGLGRQDIIEI
ncbi:MAG: queuosine precursor transporter [Flavobacteriaceae bacterium]|nr:queuosine precursor transporter [Flavobacteriaceae bacterium]MCY4267494.1 queuosine precursor transporter [Flavobacteriaceae bacterium]MCY4299356.1 queuosine precursor transporter [Flavobacteriaceae bacterium]